MRSPLGKILGAGRLEGCRPSSTRPPGGFRLRLLIQLAVRARTVIALSIVGTLIASTVVALAAAEGMSTITVDVEFESPRALESERLFARVLTPGETGGYGYGAGSDPAGYGSQFVNWLQNGYGYYTFDVDGYTASGARIVLDGVPIGTYRVQVWYELNGVPGPQEGVEPITFAQFSSGGAEGSTLVQLSLGDAIEGTAVLAEPAAHVTGHVFDEDGAAIPGASVVAVHDAPGVTQSFTTTTGTDGAFAFAPGLPTGTHYDIPYAFLASIVIDGVEYSTASPTLVSVPKEGAIVPLLEIDLPEPVATLSALTATPVDADADGVYEGIDATVQLATTGPMDLSVLATLLGGGASITEDALPATVYDGTATLTFRFAGEAISAAGIDPTTVRIDATDLAATPSTIAPLTGDFALGAANAYLGAGTQVAFSELAATPLDANENGLIDAIRVSGIATPTRHTEVIVYGEVLDATGAYIASGHTATLALGGPTSFMLEIPGDAIGAGSASPASIQLLALHANGFHLGEATLAFPGTTPTDYEARIKLPTSAIQPRFLGAPVTSVEIDATPIVGEAGGYRFSFALLSTDGVEIASVLVPADDAHHLDVGSAATLTGTFDGAALARAYEGYDWTLDRVAVAVFDEDYTPLVFAERSLGATYTRASFAAGIAPLALPAENAPSIVVTCGDARADCADASARPALGWPNLHVRFPVTVNAAGAYALGGALESSGTPVADVFADPATLPLGTLERELSFAGREIASRAAGGNVARVRIDAYDAFLDHLAATSATFPAVSASSFESLGVTLAFGPVTLVDESLRQRVTLTHVGRTGETFDLHLNLLASDTLGYVTHASRALTLPAGPLELDVDFDGDALYAHMADASLDTAQFRVGATLVDDAGDIVLSALSNPTGNVALASFPQPPVRLGHPLAATARDTSPFPDGLLDVLDVSVPLVLAPGAPAAELGVSVAVYGPGHSLIDARYEEFTAAPGATRIPAELTSIPGASFSAAQIDGPYLVHVSLFADGESIGYDQVETTAYQASQFASRGLRLTGVTDAALGANPPGLDGVRLTGAVALSSGAAGRYVSLGILYTPDWSLVGYALKDSHLDESTTAIEWTIPGDHLRAAGIDGTLRYVVYIYDVDGETIVAVAEGLTGRTYRSADFRVVGAEWADPATFTDAIALGGSALRVGTSLEVGATGSYHLWSALYTDTGRFVAFAQRDVDLAAGTHAIAFDFDQESLVAAGHSGAYQAYVYAFDAAYGHLDEAGPKATAAYPSSTWSFAPALDVTGVSINEAAPAPLSGVSVTIDYTVNRAGTYTLAARLATSGETGARLDGALTTLAFDASGLGAKTLTLTFEAQDILANLPAGYSGPLSVHVGALRGVGLRAQNVDETSATTSASYARGSFVALVDPLAITGAFSWESLQLGGDTRFDALRIGIPVNAAVAGTYRIDADLMGPRGWIATVSRTVTLAEGASVVELDVNGADIAAKNQNGRYRLSSLVVYHVGASGSFDLVERASAASSPTTYRAADFS